MSYINGDVVGATKTRGSVRDVVLADDLCELLARYLDEYPWEASPTAFLFPGRVDHRSPRVATCPPAPVTMSQFATTMLRRAGLVDEEGKPITSMQGLRATGATLAAGAGVPLLIVQRQLGHVGPSVAERHYLFIDDLDQRRVFADVFAGRG